MKPNAYYPLFANLHNRRCVVIGGGLVAQRKVTTLLRYGAKITVVSPSVTRRLAAYAKQGRIRYAARRFRPADLRGAWLVYASTDEQRINEQVFREATRRRIFTNVVDQKPLCSFIAPAIVEWGTLTVAVSTGGASPSLAKKVRSDVGRVLGSSYVPMIRLLAGLRGVAKRTLPSYADRKRYFGELVEGRVFQLMRAGKSREARRLALDVLARRGAKNGRH
jgi:siroheme synthase-like protein